MDISSGSRYPALSLSNFAPHEFEIDNIKCASMEGFLQSLKFQNPDMQKYVCSLVGKAAKFKGKNKKWQKTGNLYWQSEVIKRDSERYQELLDKAYNALAKNIPLKSFKLFSKPTVAGAGYDQPMMTPEEVFSLTPRPYLIMYQ